VWVDIEITRLQPDADGIIDIAMLTDVQLAIVAEGRAPADERAGCRSWRRISTTTISTSPR
jgi:oligoribonuclease (3'-5' exoribonuclease)